MKIRINSGVPAVIIDSKYKLGSIHEVDDATGNGLVTRGFADVIAHTPATGPSAVMEATHEALERIADKPINVVLSVPESIEPAEPEQS